MTTRAQHLISELDALKEQIADLERECSQVDRSAWLWDVDEECDIRRRILELEEIRDDVLVELAFEIGG